MSACVCVCTAHHLHKSLSSEMVVKMKWKACNRIIILNYKFKQKPEQKRKKYYKI